MICHPGPRAGAQVVMSRRWRVHCYFTWIPEQVRDDMSFVTRGNPVQYPMCNAKKCWTQQKPRKKSTAKFCIAI